MRSSSDLAVVEASHGRLKPQNLQFLCNAIYDDSGIVLDESKSYLLEARLMPIAKDEGHESIDDLCNLMRGVGGAKIRSKVVEAMTTNETLFFRDIRPFDALRQELFPALLDSVGKNRPVRIWSAAASTGQEAYSIAMVWRELGGAPEGLRIFGTDLSDSVLKRANEGRFRQVEVNRGLPASMLVKYFSRDGQDWIVKPELRRMTSWVQFNLLESPLRFGKFDIIFCRNVLIYFDHETKERILQNLSSTLYPGGCLLLGSSETTLTMNVDLKRELIAQTNVYRKPA